VFVMNIRFSVIIIDLSLGKIKKNISAGPMDSMGQIVAPWMYLFIPDLSTTFCKKIKNINITKQL
jgi:hypothetical protein